MKYRVPLDSTFSPSNPRKNMESGKKNIEPGWNDPPIFSYTESTDHVRKAKRNLLTKRVAYPVSSSAKNEQSISTSMIPHSSSDLPPPITPPTTLPSHSVPAKDDHCDEESITARDIDSQMSEDMLQTVLDNINHVMSEKDHLLRSQNKHEQIRKKIHILEESWNSKLSDDLKRRVLRLSAVMKDHDKNKANEIQASLMVDFPKLCGEFIPALRMLINAE